MKLSCKTCGAKAWLQDGAVARECVHTTDGVTADMEAVAYGQGSAALVQEDGRLAFFRAVLTKIIAKIRGR